jgi:leucyl aminopeptidase
MINTITKISTANTLIVPFLKGESLAKDLLTRSKAIGYEMEELEESFKAERGEILNIATPDKDFKRMVFVGLGEKPNGAQVIEVFRLLFYKNKKKWKGEIVVDIKTVADYCEYFANGLALSEYEIGALKTREEAEETIFTNGVAISFLITANQEEKVNAAIDKGLKMADSQRNILYLVDAPANYKTPEMIAKYIKTSGKKYGYKVKVWDEKACEKEGFHALLAVGKGSVESPCRMVMMEYTPSEPTNKTIGLVGKGVTFDTGGVSLKPGEGMQYMKSDMGGSAAVIGALEMAAKLRLKSKVVGIVALTENCVDSLAIKPGDVIKSYSGKTIEIINTDAEGRLILADAVNYMATQIDPTVMIDLATLTGSCIRTLGYAAAGLMTQNDKLAENLYKRGQETGEKLWRLPLWDDYKSMMDSDIADIKNLSMAPLAGATTAGKFIEFFTNKHPNWAHLDIAGTAFGSTDYGKDKSATAYGIRLLTAFIQSF